MSESLTDAELIAELERHIAFNFTTDCREEIVQVVDRFKALRAKSAPHCPTCSCAPGSWGDHIDAKRYRWLKNHHLQLGPDCWIRTGDDLDEAIDVEMDECSTSSGDNHG